MKNKILVNLFIIFQISLFTACISSRQPLNPIVKNEEEKIIGFGAGGGIAGHYNNCYLYNNGRLVCSDGFPNQEPVTKEEYKLSQALTDSLFTAINNSGIKTLDFNYPSNMSEFLSLKQIEKTYAVTWGGEKHPPEAIEKLYERLNDIILKLRNK